VRERERERARQCVRVTEGERFALIAQIRVCVDGCKNFGSAWHAWDTKFSCPAQGRSHLEAWEKPQGSPPKKKKKKT
jgi:hypothetical protein